MRSRKIKIDEIAVDCEHPAYQIERCGIVFWITLNGDGEAVFMMKLSGAYDDRRGKTGERAYVVSLWRKSIDNIGGEPPEHAHREIEAVRHFERNLMFVEQLTPASMIRVAPQSYSAGGDSKRFWVRRPLPCIQV